MTLKDIGCLLIDNNRSRAYIQKMAAGSMLPSQAVYLNKTKRPAVRKPESADPVEALVDGAFRSRKYFLYDPVHRGQSLLGEEEAAPRGYGSFDPDEPVSVTLEKYGVDTVNVDAPSVNSPEVVEVVRSVRPSILVFGGGGILGREVLSQGKRFIHVHPGIIPRFRGSHCIEWSVLMGESPGASAIFMNEGIDAGALIATRGFDPPELEDGSMPPLYSSHIRSELLMDVLKGYAEKGVIESTPQDPEAGEVYYKMHPALANLVYHALGG